jgi:hypothetical protein
MRSTRSAAGPSAPSAGRAREPARGDATLLRGGGVAWLRAVRDGAAAVRVAVGAAGVSTGVLDALRGGPADAGALRARLGLADDGLLEPWLRVLEAHGLVRRTTAGWALSRRGRRLLDDEVLRAASLGFAAYHTGLYRDLGAQLRGGPARRDVAEQGAIIAQLSRAMEPFLHGALAVAVRKTGPRRALDVGCGAGQNLAAMLEASPRRRAWGSRSTPPRPTWRSGCSASGASPGGRACSPGT